MKAITIINPWAWHIIRGTKDIENRTWPTRIRGRVLIHVSKSPMRDFDYANTLALDAGCRVIPTLWEAHAQRGMVIGSVEIVDCVQSSDSPWFDGPYGFVLRDPRPMERPFPWRGKQGFFNIPMNPVGDGPAPMELSYPCGNDGKRR